MDGVEPIYKSPGRINDLEIALERNSSNQATVHVVVDEDVSNDQRLEHLTRQFDGKWNAQVLKSSTDAKYHDINLARKSAEAPRSYELPFLAMTFVGADGLVHFLRVGNLPVKLALQALARTFIYFTVSGFIIFAMFIVADISISRQQAFSVRLSVAHLMILIVLLVVENFYSWAHRDVLFLQPDIPTIVTTLVAVFSAIVALIGYFGKIVDALKRFGEFLGTDSGVKNSEVPE